MSSPRFCLLSCWSIVRHLVGGAANEPGEPGRFLTTCPFSRDSVSIFGWRHLRALSGAHTVIEVQHLTKRYGRVTAVQDVSFRVERGEILGFLGPNGAGKTTTMRILTGYMPATEGRAIVAGFD